MTYVDFDYLALPVVAHSGFSPWHVSISDEGSLPEVKLSDASKLVYIKVHVL